MRFSSIITTPNDMQWGIQEENGSRTELLETYNLRFKHQHPEGTSNNSDIFQEYQKILIGVYNGGL